MQPQLSEKRAYPRFRPEDLTAQLIVGNDPKNRHRLSGKVLDIGFNGVKIQLTSPFPDIEHKERITIEVKLPITGIPITINGCIRYVSESTQFGLFCGNDTPREVMDKLLFECFRPV